MTDKTNKNTKLTLASLIQKKANKATQEVKTKDVYVASLDAEITLSSVKRNVIYNITDNDADTLEEKMYMNSLVVYHGVSLFQHADFVGDGDPADAVNDVLEPYEINELAETLMILSGFAKSDKVDEIKN